MKSIFTLMEKLMAKPTLLERFQAALDESAKDASCWKTGGVVRDMGQQKRWTCLLCINLKCI
jgi:hypothetical protein